MINFSHHRTVGQSLREYGRGIAGGLMFSMPLFYTSEVWAAGLSLHPGRILLFGAATFGLLLLYNRYSGLRRDASLAEVAIDSVEELGIGLVLSAVVLALTGRIGLESGKTEMLGKVVVEAMTMAVGVSIGTAQLGAPDDEQDQADGDGTDDPAAFLPQMAIALCGAVLFAANVAPTDEVVILASEASPLRLLALMGFSLGICTLVFHFADFHGAGDHVARDSWLQITRGVVGTYAVSLLASAGILWFFGRLDGAPLSHVAAMAVVLGVPAVLGASAGRLILQAGMKSSSTHTRK